MSETLLERRIRERRDLLGEFQAQMDLVDICVKNDYRDLSLRIYNAGETLQKVVALTRKIDDLEDVRKYGPGGGR